jgi:hypothetical protein
MKLDPVVPVAAPAVEKVAPVVDRCSGRNWAAALAAACRADTWASITAAPRVTEAAPAAESDDTVTAQSQPDENAPASGETFSGFGLPTVGSLSTARLLRAAREVPVQAGKAVDALFRFASKYRLRNTEDGWEVTRFKDVMSENRTQASGVKAMGVELMLPFQ